MSELLELVKVKEEDFRINGQPVWTITEKKLPGEIWRRHSLNSLIRASNQSKQEKSFQALLSSEPNPVFLHMNIKVNNPTEQINV